MRKLILVIFILPVFLSKAQPVIFGQKAGSIKNKPTHFIGIDSLLTEYHQERMAEKWPGIIIGETTFNEKLLADTGHVFIAVTPAEGKSGDVHLTAFKGHVALKNFDPDKPWNYNAPHIASLCIDEAYLLPELMPTYLLSLKNMVDASVNAKTYEEYYIRYSNMEWINSKERSYILEDRLTKAYRDRSVLKKLGIQSLLIVNESNLLGETGNPKTNAVWLDHRSVNRAGKRYIQIYIYEVNRGLRFFVEEELEEKGMEAVGRAYLSYLFRAEQGERMIPPEKDITESKMSKPKVIRQ